MVRYFYLGFVEFSDVQVFSGEIADNPQLPTLRGWTQRTAYWRDAGRIMVSRFMSGTVYAKAPKLITELFSFIRGKTSHEANKTGNYFYQIKW